MKRWTAEQCEKHEQKIIKQANIWLQNYTPEQVADFIWNKYGYMTGTKNGTVLMKGHKGYLPIN